MKRWVVSGLLLLSSCALSNAQIKRTEMPLGDALNKALSKSSLTSPGSQPFHIRVAVSEPQNLQSPYQGTIEEWWYSADKWRREVTGKDGLKQTTVMTNGQKTEHDEGDYFPLWLRSFVTAVFDPVPNATAWNATKLQIEQITMPDGAKSDACARSEGKIGEGDRATTSYSNLCFDGEGRLKFVGSPRYNMELLDYKGFAKKQIPRKFVDHPEPGTELVGAVNLLEEESRVKDEKDLFTPLSGNENRFESIQVSSAQMLQLSSGNPDIIWPPVHSGNIHGRLAMYVSMDAKGQIREAWPLNADNAGLEDPAREQVRQWKMKLAKDKSGNFVQVDGGLSFAFDTKIGDPLPQLSDAEVRALATRTVDPVWPAGVLKSGDTVEVQVSVNEKGELAGTGFVGVPVAASGPANSALSHWKFRPLIHDGKPQYFHGVVRFVVP